MIISRGWFFVVTIVFVSISPVPVCFSWICNAVIVGSPEGKTLQECLEFITFHYTRCCIVCVKTMRSNSETDRNKSAQYKVNGFYRKFFKKSDKFLKYARAYLCKGCYSPAWAREDMALQIGDNLQTFVWWGWGEERSLCPPAYKRL